MGKANHKVTAPWTISPSCKVRKEKLLEMYREFAIELHTGRVGFCAASQLEKERMDQIAHKFHINFHIAFWGNEHPSTNYFGVKTIFYQAFDSR